MPISLRDATVGKLLDPRLCAAMIRAEIHVRGRFAGRLRQIPLEQAVASGDVLGPARRVEGPGRNDWLEAAAYYSRYRKGDKVDLCSYAGGSQTQSLGSVEIKDVTYPRQGTVRLEVSRKRKDRPSGGVDLFLYPEESRYLDHMVGEAVEFAATARRPARTTGLHRLQEIGRRSRASTMGNGRRSGTS